MMKGPPGARHYRAPGSTLKRMEMVVALNEQALLEFLKNLVSKLAVNFRTEAELASWHTQVDNLVETAEEDVKEDAAEVTTP